MIYSELIDLVLSFLAYFGTSLAIILAYLVIYMWVTPHNELALIRDNNTAASAAAIGSLVGFTLPLFTIIQQSGSLVECIFWGGVAIIVQVLIFFLVRLPIPKISDRIENGELASGIWLGGASLTGGLLNAACMTG